MSSQLLAPLFAASEDVRPGCVFCRILSDPAACGDADVPLFEDSDFVAFASLGGFVEGWLLMAPRRHVINLSLLKRSEAERFSKFRSHVTAAVERIYGATISFEHGPRCHGQEAGCGVDHAHLHVVPFGECVRDHVTAAAPPDTEWLSGRSVSLESLAARESSYVYLRDRDGHEIAGLSQAIPSQLVRRVLRRRALGDDSYDWRQNPSHEVVSRTIARLA